MENIRSFPSPILRDHPPLKQGMEDRDKHGMQEQKKAIRKRIACAQKHKKKPRVKDFGIYIPEPLAPGNMFCHPPIIRLIYTKRRDYIQRLKRCAVIPFNQCDPGGARTLDPLIKSQLLYQLSYGVMLPTGIALPSLRMQRYNLSANRPNIFSKKFSRQKFSLYFSPQTPIE